MADVSYESLQSKIASQRQIIKQRKIAGAEGIESLRKVHPRTPPGVYFGQVQPQIKTIKGRLVELESAEKELSEHEQLLAERKAEGYKIRETDEGKIEFFKEVYTPGERVQVGTREVSIMVHWVNPKTGKTGRFQGRQSQIADYERQLGSTGRHVTKVTTIGGGEPIYKEKEGFWTTKDVILWEAPAIVKKPVAYRPVYEMTDEIKFLLEYADPEEKEELKKAFEAGPVQPPEGFVGPVQQPIYPAFKKSFESLTPEEKTSYAEQFPVKVITAPALPFSEQVTALYGTERLDIYAAKHIQDWGIPSLIAGVQTLTGLDKGAWGRLHEQYAAEILESTRRPGETLAEYSSRFWTSSQAILNVYLPTVTMGVGYAVKPFAMGLKAVQPTSKIFPVTSRIVYYGAKYHKVIVGGTIGVIGGITAYQVAKEPEAAPLIIGRTVAGFGKMYGGYQVGGRLYTATHAKLIQQSYWTGTEFEQISQDVLRRQSIASSQYQKFEFGHPSTHYTAMIRPAWQKFPYVPKTPTRLHTVTFGIRDPIDPSKGFYIKRQVLSSRDFATYETTPVTVDVAGKDYTFTTFSGEATVKGATRRVVGFGRGKYVGDISDDILASRMYGYSVSEGVRPTIIRGIAVQKTYYGGAAEWVGKDIKFFTPGRETDITLGLSFGKARGLETFDISQVVKPSLKAKSYFGDPGGFDYSTQVTKLIDDVIMPGGIQMETGLKISLKSPFGPQLKPIRYVDFYDVGMQISSYWKGVSPVVGSIPTTLSIQKMELETISSSMQKIGVVPVVKTIQASVPISREIQSQFTVPSSITKSLSSSISAQESISVSMTKQLQQQMQLTQQISITALIQITPQISMPPPSPPPIVPISIYHPPPTVTPTPPTPPPPHIPYIFGALPDITTYKMFGHTMGQGYHTYVKERHHFEGKKLKEGKMVRLSKHPLSRLDALSLGGMAIDNSAAATFEIRPVNAMAQSPLIKLKSFESFQDKFYMKDSKYIEKPKHRIDTKGEVKGISALGWYAERTTKAAKKKPVRRPRAKEVRERDMFDMGMDDMLIDMDKIFKGVFDIGIQ